MIDQVVVLHLMAPQMRRTDPGSPDLVVEPCRPIPPAVPGGPVPKEGHMKSPIEAKVKAATVGCYLAGTAGLAVLAAVKGDLSLIDFLPAWAQAVTVPLIPTAITWVSGFRARHTPRPDLGR